MISGAPKTALVAIIVALLATPAARAADKARAETIITVYVNAHTGHGLEKDVNALHARMEQEGWKFADLEPHLENGDTEGAWVTYTK